MQLVQIVLLVVLKYKALTLYFVVFDALHGK